MTTWNRTITFAVALCTAAFLMMVLYTGAGGMYFEGTWAERSGRADEIAERAARAAAADNKTADESVAMADVEPADEAPVEEAPAVEEDVAPEEETASAASSAYPDLPGDIANGEAIWRQCSACHVNDAEQNRIGPHLVGVLGREVASVDGFRYSDALLELDGQWTPEQLNVWLENPSDYAPGTKMSYRGVSDPTDREDIIKYLSQF